VIESCDSLHTIILNSCAHITFSKIIELITYKSQIKFIGLDILESKSSFLKSTNNNITIKGKFRKTSTTKDWLTLFEKCINNHVIILEYCHALTDDVIYKIIEMNANTLCNFKVLHCEDYVLSEYMKELIKKSCLKLL
jgi:hypothetical protein